MSRLGRDPIQERGTRGQVAVEALLVLLVLVVLTFGGIELAQGVALRQALDAGTAAAVRALSLDPGQWSYSTSLVQSGVNQNVMGAKPTVTLQILNSSGVPRSSGWLNGQAFGTAFILESSAPFQSDIPLLETSAVTVKVRHWGVVERYP